VEDPNPVPGMPSLDLRLVRVNKDPNRLWYHLKDRNGEPERGEWMRADKNSIQEFSLWTRFHSCTSTSFSCQVHIATEVLLNLGARLNQQPQHTHAAKTHTTQLLAAQTGQAGFWNRSDRFCWT
jgi:hypothetical protein